MIDQERGPNSFYPMYLFSKLFHLSGDHIVLRFGHHSRMSNYLNLYRIRKNKTTKNQRNDHFDNGGVVQKRVTGLSRLVTLSSITWFLSQINNVHLARSSNPPARVSEEGLWSLRYRKLLLNHPSFRSHTHHDWPDPALVSSQLRQKYVT